MEFVPGIDLHRLIKLNGPLKWTEMAGYGLQIAEGLKHIHNNNLLHLGLNSKNIMIQWPQRAVIMDFAFSLKITTKIKLDRNFSEKFFYMYSYACPDNINKAEPEIDTLVEIFHFGVIMYECLTGRFPYDADKRLNSEERFKINPVPPHDLISEIPIWFSNLIMKCLEKDRKKRIKSAQEIIKILDEHHGKE